MNKNKLVARAYIMGIYGMMQCAANFSNGCNVVDDESHRMNHCPKWGSINLADLDEYIDYDLIHAECEEDSMRVARLILTLWDLGNNRNCMAST